MKKYILTSQSFTGSVTFGYANGVLMLYDNQTQMNDVQVHWLLSRIPLAEENCHTLAAQIKGKLEELPEDLTFDRFWEKYGKKINRKRCEPLWNKLSAPEKMQALRSIDPYKAYLVRTRFRGQMDPENYLRNGSYETNWNAEK